MPKSNTNKNMKQILLTAILLMASIIPAIAQEPLISSEDSKTLLGRISKDGKAIASSNMNLQFYTSTAAEFDGGEFQDLAFKLNKVRLEILGNIGNNLSYHFRQSFNKGSDPHSLDNLSSSVEYAFLKWKLTPAFDLTIGKQFVHFGGQENWLNGIKIREFSDFNSSLPFYQAGINAAFHLTPSQEINLQLTNIRNGEEDEIYTYGVPEGIEKAKLPFLGTANYDGKFYDGALQFRYSLSYGQLARNKNVFYFTCSNVWERGPAMYYLDVMYSREGIDSKGLISELSAVHPQGGVTAQNVDYFTVIANADYRVHPCWNLYVKGAYELGSVYKNNGLYEKGLYRRTWNIQACAEFFPKDVEGMLIFLHLSQKGRSLTGRAKTLGCHVDDTQRISLGLVYTIPVF